MLQKHNSYHIDQTFKRTNVTSNHTGKRCIPPNLLFCVTVLYTKEHVFNLYIEGCLLGYL